METIVNKILEFLAIILAVLIGTLIANITLRDYEAIEKQFDIFEVNGMNCAVFYHENGNALDCEFEDRLTTWDNRI